MTDEYDREIEKAAAWMLSDECFRRPLRDWLADLDLAAEKMGVSRDAAWNVLANHIRPSFFDPTAQPQPTPVPQPSAMPSPEAQTEAQRQVSREADAEARRLERRREQQRARRWLKSAEGLTPPR